MSKAQIVVTHRRLPESVTIEVDRDLLMSVLHGHNKTARKRLILMFKVRYGREHVEIHDHLSWEGLGFSETEESANRPHGCGCECPGCDQGYHCHKEAKECYM